MGDHTLSDILGLFIPSGVCVLEDGEVVWLNDTENILQLTDKMPEKLSEIVADTDHLDNLTAQLNVLKKGKQYLYPKPVKVNDASCYINIKNLGEVKDYNQVFAINFIKYSQKNSGSVPEHLIKTMGSVNVDYYVKNLGIPFSLFYIIRDEEFKPVDLRFLSVNQAYIEMSSKAEEELVGAKYSDIYSTIDEDFVSLLGGISQERGATKFIDFEKGLKRYSEISAYSPVDDIVGCVYNDITDLVLANKSLQQEEEYIRTLVEVNPDIIFVFDKEGVFKDCHASDISKLFKGKIDFIGKTIYEVMSPELAETTFKHISSVIENKRLEEFQYELEFPDGLRFFEARMVPHNIDKVVCIVRDITRMRQDQKELEKRRNEILENNRFLTEVMEGVGYPLWVIDVLNNKKLIIRDLNTQYQEVFGIDTINMKGLEIEEKRKFYDKAYVDNVISHYYNCIKTRKPETHERVLISKETRKRVYLLVTLMPKLDEKGNVYRIIGSATDITGLKQTQDDLIMAKEKALEADKLKSTFLANMSHEIRTPLNSITGFSELIQDEDLTPEERQDMCRIIEKNSNQLLKLVNDIIEISKIESEQIKLIFRNFDINHLMNELVQEIELDMYRKRKILPFKVSKGTKEGFLFSSDEFRIKQIFQHLLDNALKFTSEGEIEFGYEVLEQSNEVEFFVRDTGIGIPADKQDSIFELFRQLDESSTRKYGGTGLGLSICKRLVTALEGKMWVESKANEGATFRFRLKNVTGPID
ncbi:ATP-binding protein [Saccharicrinis sp. FJH62]|uniref:sensor histidine kinase n=1 Tax=Saccharicrinis sp. FJH62 TaxID=3344657 RepID=UPI0035D404CD